MELTIKKFVFATFKHILLSSKLITYMEQIKSNVEITTNNLITLF
jgi:hypothetical protein